MIAGFKVTFPKTGQPTINTNPTSATYNQGADATALSVSATAANSGELSYQWYKNTTNQSALTTEGATAIDGANNATYTPSTAEAGTTYYFCKVTEAGNENVATSRIAKVLINPPGFDVTYSLGTVTGTVGTVPEGASHVTAITIPKNKTLYKEGYTLIGWTDGSADHQIDAEVSITENTTLTPVFSENGTSKYLGKNASTATWNFNNQTGAPEWNMDGSGTFVYVTQTTIGGNNMDVMMMMDATNGKIVTNDAWTQINQNSKLTVPVIIGAVVKVYVYYDDGRAAITFDGNDGSFDSTNKIYSYTATADGDLDIIYGGNDYAKKVEVEYPKLESTSGDVTFDLKNSSFVVGGTTIDDVTLASTGGATKDYLNLASNNTITISSTNSKRITQVVLTYTGSGSDRTGGGSDLTVNPYDAGYSLTGSTGTWNSQYVGGEASVTFTTANKARVETVVVTYVEAEAVSTLAGRNYGTHVTSSKLDFTNVTNAKAYIATGLNGGGNAVVLTQVNKVPANEPIIIYTTDKTNAATVYIPKTTADADAVIEDNALVAGDGTTDATPTATTTYYFIKADQFHQAKSGTLASGKAYLKITSTGAPDFLSFIFDDGEAGTTGLNEELRMKSEEFATAEWYMLDGRKVKNPTKGLYIVNGKKVIVK